jgi:hypothetical protein
MAKPIPIKLNDANFLKRLRLVLRNEAKVAISPHAVKRMKERKVGYPRVIACLEKGVIDESAHLSAQGDWKATLRHRSAGEEIKVAAALHETAAGDWCIVVTVMN